MGEYTQEYMEENFAIGGVADHGVSWWGRIGADGKPIGKFFDAGIPESVIRDMIGWDPVQVPEMWRDPATGDLVEHPKRKIVLRSDTFGFIGANGGASNLFPYWDWFINGPKTLLDTSELYVGFVGLFHDGAQAAVQIDMTKILDPYTGMEFKPFIFFHSSLDGSSAPECGVGSQLMVCDNTTRIARAQAKKSGLLYRLKQTANARPDWNEARDTLGIMHTMADDIMAELHALADVTVTPKQWAEFLDAHVPVTELGPDPSRGAKQARTIADNKRSELSRLYVADERAATWSGTALGVSQAVTTWAQHFATVKNQPRLARHKLSTYSGATADVQRQAMTLLSHVIDRPIPGFTAPLPERVPVAA